MKGGQTVGMEGSMSRAMLEAPPGAEQSLVRGEGAGDGSWGQGRGG